MLEANDDHPTPGVVGKQLPFGIDGAFLPIKAFYFGILAALGVLFPYITLYMRQLGLSSTETGIIFCVIAFIGTFVRPMSGALADKYQCHKLVLISATAATGISIVLLLTVPRRPTTQVLTLTTNLICDNHDSIFRECHNYSKNDGCHVGDRFNNTALKQCSFMCTSKHEGLFETCYTNNTKQSFQDQKCDGILITGKQMDFVVDNIQFLLDSQVIHDHDSKNCTFYNIKHVWYQGEFWQMFCNESVDLKCVVDCDGSEAAETCDDESSKSSQSHYDITFFLFFFLFLVGNVVVFPIMPILDAIIYDKLGEQRRHEWGQIRLWGSFGFASFAVTSTFVMYYLSQDKQDLDYSYCFYIFGVLCIMSATVAYFIRASSQIKCGRVFKNMWMMLAHPQVTTFILVIAFMGVMLGGMEAFMFWFLAALDSHPLVFGFKLAISCASEVPMFWVSSTIVQRLGVMPCLYLALASYSVRLLAYSFLVNPWLVLLVEPLHAVNFALMYAAATSYASIIAPPGMSATLQGLLYGVLFGCGKGTGSLVTGVLFEELGPRWTWRLLSILCVVVLIIYFLLNTFVFKSAHVTRPTNQNESSGKEAESHRGLVSPQHSKDIPLGDKDSETVNDDNDDDDNVDNGNSFIEIEDKPKISSQIETISKEKV